MEYLYVLLGNLFLISYAKHRNEEWRRRQISNYIYVREPWNRIFSWCDRDNEFTIEVILVKIYTYLNAIAYYGYVFISLFVKQEVTDINWVNEIWLGVTCGICCMANCVDDIRNMVLIEKKSEKIVNIYLILATGFIFVWAFIGVVLKITYKI